MKKINYKEIVELAFLDKKNFLKKNFKLIKKVIIKIIDDLDAGQIRVAEKKNGKWIVNLWLKKAILLYFKLNKCILYTTKYKKFFDKIPFKFNNYSSKDFIKKNIRVVPEATIRKGSYISKNTIIMPSFINIGAYIDSGVMIDTWSTIGSCAQIGKNVHISGGVGIGGVLEPLQDFPTIIEDNCFIGARSEICEGIIVKKSSVISTGVFISKSTPIYDRKNKKISYGKIPKYSVVVPGTIPSYDKSYNINCAIIVKKVDKKTKSKTKLNSLLRENIYS